MAVTIAQLTEHPEVEYVCLNCRLPECDEGAPGCIYARARAEQDTEKEPAPRKRNIRRELEFAWRTRRSQSKACPICGTPITNKASACRTHAR